MVNESSNDPMKPPTVVLDREVTFTTREVGGRTIFVAHHEATGKFFQFGSEEYRVAILLDGFRGVPEIYQTLQREGMNWSTEDLAKFIAHLVKSNIAILKNGDPTAHPSDETETAILQDLAEIESTCNQSRWVSEKSINQNAHELNPSDPKRGDPHTSDPNRVEASSLPLAPPPSGPPPARPNQFTSLLRLLSLLISQRIPLFRGERFATVLNRRIGRAFDPIGVFVWCILVGSGLCVVYGHREAFASELRLVFDPGLWPVLVLIWAISKVIHEAGHAVAAKHHGVRVGGVGLMFFFLAPLAYVDVTDAWKLKNRIHRVQIALGGVYFELATASIAAWMWWSLPDGYLKHLAAQFFLVAGPATLLVNANPLLRLDGYYVVSDLTEIPNLRMHGRRQLGALMMRIFFGAPAGRTLLNGWRAAFATAHAASSVAFQVVWMGGLIIGVAMWAEGLGILLALAALLLWFVVPVTTWIWKVWMMESSGRFWMNHYRWRLLYLGSVLVILFQQLGTVSSPFDRRVPVVIRFQDEQVARSPSDAFVETLFCHRGQHVEKGTLLIRLSDPDLTKRRDAKADDVEISELQAIQFRRQGELSKSATFQENANSLRRQLAELDAQIDQLTITAQRSGYIVGSQVETLEGRFVSAGEELFRVSDPREKELLAAIPEEDIGAFQDSISKEITARVRLRGGKTISAKPTSVRPRAYRTLLHPALAATVGGPLAVEPSPTDSNEVRLANPHLESITKLDPVTSSEVRAGQLGTMTIRDNRPLLARISDAVVRDFRRFSRVTQ